jgi:DNA-binding NarL/FixJ family response regulator
MVVIASNNLKLVNRLNHALQKKYQLYIVNQKSSLLRSIVDIRPRLLLLDAQLPRLRLIRELPNIQKLSPVTRILVVSPSPSNMEAIGVLRAGAKGYCGRYLSAALLNKAARAVLRDEIWAAHTTVAALIKELVSPTNRIAPVVKSNIPLAGLSPRKQQIASLMIEGSTNKEIGDRLGITVATVKAHVTGIFRQLKLSRRHELARFFEVQPTGGQPGKTSSEV